MLFLLWQAQVLEYKLHEGGDFVLLTATLPLPEHIEGIQLIVDE